MRLVIIDNVFYLTKAVDTGRAKLVRQPRQITRNGKIVNTYVWVNLDKEKKVSSNKKMLDKQSKVKGKQSMRIKQGLKKTDEIATYLASKLKSLGFEIDKGSSGLSNSEYLTITNYQDITGKVSQYNDKELKIRVSNHDLPPSYDGLHGYHDIDIKSGGVSRAGNDGNATDYESFLATIANSLGVQTPEYTQREEKKREALLAAQSIRKQREQDKITSKEAAIKQLQDEYPEQYQKYLQYQEKLGEVVEVNIGGSVVMKENKYKGKERKKITERQKDLLKMVGYKPV